MRRLYPYLVMLTVIVALTVIVGLRAFLEPVPREQLEQLRKGMTKDEVRRILGEPAEDYGGQWTYARPLVFGFVNIHWLTNGTYNGEYNYERF